MEWAEELKMSLRKTTARKGRRSKSRDLLKDGNSTPSVTSPDATVNKELSIDITLDMQQQQQPQISSTAGNSISPPSTATGDFGKRPPVRRISGGWADSGGLKSLKSKKSGSFDDERFQSGKFKSATYSPPEDDIPIIPDLDDIKDDVLLNEIAEPPSVTVNRVVTLKELDSDLLSQNAFSAIQDVDLSILTRCLQAQETLDESDEVWEWDKVFTDVIADIHSDTPQSAAAGAGVGAQKTISSDELQAPIRT